MGMEFLMGSEISNNWHLLSTYQGPGTMLSAFYTSHFDPSVTWWEEVVSITCTSW